MHCIHTEREKKEEIVIFLFDERISLHTSSYQRSSFSLCAHTCLIIVTSPFDNVRLDGQPTSLHGSSCFEKTKNKKKTKHTFNQIFLLDRFLLVAHCTCVLLHRHRTNTVSNMKSMSVRSRWIEHNCLLICRVEFTNDLIRRRTNDRIGKGKQ